MRVVVNTPSGKIGSVVTDRLLSAGERVTVISRNPEKVASFVGRGADLVEGSIDDPAVLDRAFSGADAVFWLTPPDYLRPDFLDWAKRTAEAAAGAARRNGLRRAVVVSSAGAQHGPGAGPIGVLRAVEEAFAASLDDVTSLRAGFFMENFLHDVPSIAQSGTIYGPIPAGLRFPVVATRDVGARAAEILGEAPRQGFRTLGAHGPQDLTLTEAAEIIAEGIERPVSYIEVTVAQACDGMRASGFPSLVVELLGEMYEAVRRGGTGAAEPRTADSTTPTSLLAFAREAIKPAVDALSRPAAVA